jgi:hypothetical protein
LTSNLPRIKVLSVNLSTAYVMKTVLDNLIEELEAETWGPSQDSTSGFSPRGERRNLPDTPVAPIPSSHKPDAVAACGSLRCAGCYEVETGVRIHPPKSSEEWRHWLVKWEPKGKVQ